MRKLSIFLVLCLAVLSARVPDWVRTHEVKKYPSSKYIIGVGIGGSREEAIEQARSDIVKQIEVKVSSITELYDYEERTDSGIKTASTVETKIKTEASLVLSGVRTVEVKKHKGKYYALAVLNKSEYAKRLLIDIDNLSVKIEELKDDAVNMLEKGKFRPAIARFDTIFGVIPDLFVKSRTYIAITGKRLPRIEDYSRERIFAYLNDLLGNVKLEIVSYPEEVMTLGHANSSPLTVRVLYSNYVVSGLEGVPLLLVYSTGEVVGQRMTDAEGYCRFSFVAIPTEGDNKSGIVKVLFDVDNLPELAMDCMRETYVTYSYKVKAPVTGFDLHVTDKSGANYPMIEKLIKQRLAEYGFDVSASSDYMIECRVMVTNEKEITSPISKMVYVEIALYLEVQDKGGGDILSTMKVKSSGVGNSYHDAIKNAAGRVNIDRIEFVKFIGSVFK